MASENIITLTKENFESEISGNTPVLVDFWAEWCGPCRMLGPLIDELADEAGGRYKVAKLNVDDNGDIAAKYRVMSIPTVYVFKNGQPVDSAVGVRPKADLAAMLEKSV